MKKTFLTLAAATAAVLAASPAAATGKMTCDAPQKSWKSMDALKEKLTGEGWKVRHMKEDGGCYEVYALNEKGERGEYYFHPVTLAPVPTKSR